MRRRYIALQMATKQWHFAVASGDQTEASLLQTGSFERNPELSLVDQLTTVLGPLQMTDRLACALPAQSALLRWLEFPFSDPRKIAAAALPEMSRLLPRSLDRQAVFQQPTGTNSVLTVAIEKQQIEELISQFDDTRAPLGYLGLTPFCYAAGLEWPTDGLLLCAESNGFTLARCENGKLLDLRILPQTTADEISVIVSQVQLMAHCGATELHQLRLLGLATDSRLGQALEQLGFNIETIRLRQNELEVPAELTACACLALAAVKNASNSLNLRSGVYKLKNDWQALKRRMWLAGGLVIAILLLLIGNGSLQYRQQANELERLQQQMSGLYQQEFPGEKQVVPAPLQLQSKIKELQKRASQFGTGSPSALQLLLTVSQGIAPELSVDIKEYLYNESGLRLTGTTSNFDAVSKLLASLQREQQFQEVRILDSKQALDGSQVDFQLQIQLGGSK